MRNTRKSGQSEGEDDQGETFEDGWITEDQEKGPTKRGNHENGSSTGTQGGDDQAIGSNDGSHLDANHMTPRGRGVSNWPVDMACIQDQDHVTWSHKGSMFTCVLKLITPAKPWVRAGNEHWYIRAWVGKTQPYPLSQTKADRERPLRCHLQDDMRWALPWVSQP